MKYLFQIVLKSQFIQFLKQLEQRADWEAYLDNDGIGR